MASWCKKLQNIYTQYACHREHVFTLITKLDTVCLEKKAAMP